MVYFMIFVLIGVLAMFSILEQSFQEIYFSCPVTARNIQKIHLGGLFFPDFESYKNRVFLMQRKTSSKK